MSARDLYGKMRFGTASLDEVKEHFDVTNIRKSPFTGAISYECKPKTYEAKRLLNPYLL